VSTNRTLRCVKIFLLYRHQHVYYHYLPAVWSCALNRISLACVCPVALLGWAEMMRSRSTKRALRCVKLFSLTGVTMFMTFIVIIRTRHATSNSDRCGVPKHLQKMVDLLRVPPALNEDGQFYFSMTRACANIRDWCGKMSTPKRASTAQVGQTGLISWSASSLEGAPAAQVGQTGLISSSSESHYYHQYYLISSTDII
jgi:hypothetical protein